MVLVLFLACEKDVYEYNPQDKMSLYLILNRMVSFELHKNQKTDFL